MDAMTLSEDYGRIGVGLYDIPYSPSATVLYLNPLKTNAIIFGCSLSGKTTMVKNILARMHEEEPYRSRERIYILDFGGGIGRYAELGRVCACFDNSNEENIKRFFHVVEEEFLSNGSILGGENYLDYLVSHPDRTIPHITLILENASAFFSEERYEPYQQTLARLARDGISKGVSLLLTAAEPTPQLSRLMLNFADRFALNLPADKYFDVFGVRVDAPIKIAGRGLTVVSGEPCEFQAFLPFKPSDEAAELEKMIYSTSNTDNVRLKAFPEVLNEENIQDFSDCSELLPSQVLIGLDYYSHMPVVLDWDETHTIAVYVKKQFGKTNLLRLLLRGAQNYFEEAQYVFYDDAARQLQPFYEDYDKKHPGKAEYILKFEDFFAYLTNLAAHRLPGPDGKPLPLFLIMQNKQPFQIRLQSKGITRDGYAFTNYLAAAADNRCYFIFTDVPKITKKDICDDFNLYIKTAFLLDTMNDFLKEKGTTSVFGALDPADMKREYARCALGDGFYYDVEREELKKLKVIKA